jgi:hypothetical protein
MVARLAAVLCVVTAALVAIPSQESHAIILLPCKDKTYPNYLARMTVRLSPEKVDAFDVLIKSYADKKSLGYIYHVNSFEQVRRMISISAGDAVFITNQLGSGKIHVDLLACESDRSIWYPFWKDFKAHVRVAVLKAT